MTHVEKFVRAICRDYPEVDDYFRLRPELLALVYNVDFPLDEVFNAMPSFKKILDKYGLVEDFRMNRFSEDVSVVAEVIDAKSLRLLAQVFGYPWSIKGIEEILGNALDGIVKDENCDKQGSCGDCECPVDEKDGQVNVVVTPDGDLAYGVSDAPLTFEEEAAFFDGMRAVYDGDRELRKTVANIAEEHDAVNNPKHYTSHPSGVECIEISEKLTFNLGNAFKYVFRRDDKENTYQDLSKAEWYLNREIARLTELFETTPVGELIPIHPSLTRADQKKVSKVIAAETNVFASTFYQNLFARNNLHDSSDMASLKYALDGLRDLMGEVRRQQDEKREGAGLGDSD